MTEFISFSGDQSLDMKTLQSHINFLEWITPWDWAVFLGILVITFASIRMGDWWFKRQRSGKEAQFHAVDYLLMGRQLTLPLFIGTLVASWYGGIFGVTEIAYSSGVYNFVTQGVFWYFTYIFFAVFLVHRIRKFRSMTLPELVGTMYGPRASKIAAVFNFFNMLPIAYVMSIGILLQMITGWSYPISTAAGTTVALLYCAFGGFKSDVYSDFVQFFVMCGSVALVAFVSWDLFGGISFLEAELPASYFDWKGGHSWGETLAWGFIAAATLIDPTFYQRVWAAKSEKIARTGILLSTLIWIGFDLCTTAGGMYARALIPQTDAKTSYLTYAIQVLPPGARGFFLAGVLATILSTVDSFVFIASTTITYDLVPKRWTTHRYTHVLGVFLVGALSVLLAFGFEGSIKATWKTMGSFYSACLLAPIGMGYFFPGKIKENHFIFTVLLGAAATAFWKWVPRAGFLADVDELYIGFLVTGLSLILGIILRKK